MTERFLRKRLFHTKSNVDSASNSLFVFSSSRSRRQKSLNIAQERQSHYSQGKSRFGHNPLLDIRVVMTDLELTGEY